MMCEREAAICPLSPPLPKISNTHTHTRTGRYTQTWLQNAPTRLESRIALQYARPICLNRPAVCSVSLRVSMGIQNRLQLFTLTQPHCTQYLSDLCARAAWCRYNTSFGAIQQHAFAILIHASTRKCSLSISTQSAPTRGCWDSMSVEWVQCFSEP